MVSIPASLKAVISGTVTERNGEYVIELPPSEIELDGIRTGETYRVAIHEHGEPNGDQQKAAPQRTSRPPEPPVQAGDIVDVTVEAVGDEGDGIAKVDRGYVLIVPGGRPGDELSVRVERVHENVGFASVVGSRAIET